MKVLFLDVDGVLNSAEWMKTGNLQGAQIESLDPTCVARLERVLSTTKCKIVLSSSWRHYVSIDVMQRWLHRRGAPSAEVIDRTPNDFKGWRGQEISDWLAEHHETSRFAIVDDEDDMAPLSRWLVQTSFSVGLQDEHVDALIALLGEE